MKSANNIITDILFLGVALVNVEFLKMYGVLDPNVTPRRILGLTVVIVVLYVACCFQVHTANTGLRMPIHLRLCYLPNE
jgi:hypothetical protein